MTIDPTVLPGLSLFALELLALAVIGYVVARIALGQDDDLMALAQGLVIGPALWGLIVNFVLHAVPGLAGALVGWAIVLLLGAGLAWRAPAKLRLPPRTVAGFAGAALALLWIGLASRQLLGIPDDAIHTALPASIRAGAFPPELSWNPGVPLAYHYGADLLIGLLTPPTGPDLAFVTELMGAYLWMGFVLVVVTLLRRHGSWLGALVLAPLLLTAGAWTLIWFTPAEVLRIPVPTGLPAAGIRASLMDIYWPSAEVQWTWPSEASPPNSWKPPFLLGYGLAVVVLERVAAHGEPRRLEQIGLAMLVGFLGMVEETLALTVLGIWALAGALDLWKARTARSLTRARALGSMAGPTLAVLLLAAGGGLLTGIVTGAPRSSLSVGWRTEPSAHELMGAFSGLAGNVGLLSLGAIPVLGVALLVGWRHRLVAALAVGSALFALVAVTLQHPAHPPDVVRLDGHARNFALLALLIALSMRLHVLSPRARYAAAGGLVALAIWPSVASNVQSLSLALGNGVEVSNARIDESPSPWWDRYVLAAAVPEAISTFVRDRTSLDSRIFSPHPHQMTAATGRPNASGLVGHLNLLPFNGPEYDDVLRYLEPGAVDRLGFSYVHANDAWIATLPAHAQRWLNDPALFEPLIRDGADTLYRIAPAFPRLDTVRAPESFEALRRAVPASSLMYLAPGTQPQTDIRRATIRLVMAMPHVQMLGSLDLGGVYLLTKLPTPTLPLEGDRPDLVVMPARGVAPTAFAPAQRAPIWWKDEVAVYAPDGAVAALMEPPPGDFSIRLSEVRVEDSRIGFTAAFLNQAPDQWVGQDWLVAAGDASPWALPYEFETDGRHKGRQWYAGQILPDDGVATASYELDPRAASLSVRDERGDFIDVASSGEGLGQGAWTLAVRLRHEWHEAAFIPVMKIVVAESGAVTYEVFEGELNARLAQ